jgi:hypothetical protein
VAATAGNHQSQVRNASAGPGVSWAAPTTAAPQYAAGNDIFVGGGGFDATIGEGGDDIAIGSDAQDKTDGMSGFDWVTDKDQAVGTSKGLRAVLNTSINLLTLGPSNRL